MIPCAKPIIEKMTHGFWVGFGIIGANITWSYGKAFGCAVKDAVTQINWRRTIEQAKKEPDRVAFWRKH